jgi:hypothetical protein
MPDEAQVQMGGGQAMPASIPPEMQQQLMQMMQGMSGSDVTNLMAQLAQMSPEQAAQAISQLTGQEVDPDELVAASKAWIEDSAGQLSGEGGDGGPTDAAAGDEGGPAPPPEPTGSASPASNEEASPEEGTQADPDAEYEGMEAQAQGSPADMQGQGPGSGAGGMPTPEDMAKAQQIISSKTGGGAMPRGGMPAGVPMGGGGMDAAISASLGGDIPGGPKLRGPAGGGPRMSGPASPTVTAKATKGTNQDMIRQMYRDAAAKDRGVAQTGVKRGPRT